MKLVRPDITSGDYKWSENVDTVWTGKHSCIVCHPTNTPITINQAKAISSIPEVMDLLERCRNGAMKACLDGNCCAHKDITGEWANSLYADLTALLIRMGYVQEEELPEPELNPSES